MLDLRICSSHNVPFGVDKAPSNRPRFKVYPTTVLNVCRMLLSSLCIRFYHTLINLKTYVLTDKSKSPKFCKKKMIAYCLLMH